jgi:hypothetical protein
MSSLETVIDRATNDPDFAVRLREQPFETLRAEGYDISEAEAHAALGAADHEDFVETLRERLSRCSPAGV